MSSIYTDIFSKTIAGLLTTGIISTLGWSRRRWWPIVSNALASARLGGERRLQKINRLIAQYENFTRED